jgi:hypothetical protein
VSGAHRPLPPGGSCASWRSRVTSRTVSAPPPHHSTASGRDRLSSVVIVSSACPARLSASRTAASRSPSAQHGDRQTFEPALPVGTFFAQYSLGIQRRPPRRLPHRLLTHHISVIDTGLSLSLSSRRRLERSSLTISTCFTYPQPISKSDVPHRPVNTRPQGRPP